MKATDPQRGANALRTGIPPIAEKATNSVRQGALGSTHRVRYGGPPIEDQHVTSGSAGWSFLAHLDTLAAVTSLELVERPGRSRNLDTADAIQLAQVGVPLTVRFAAAGLTGRAGATAGGHVAATG